MSGPSSLLARYNAAMASVPDGSPYVLEEDGCVSLRFDATAIQSAMRKDAPHELVVDYTQTMMGFLLFRPEPERIAMIGLGGGSLAKYCHEFLPEAHFTAVESNPEVIALRDEFAIPPDDARFRVIHADGADFVRRPDEAVDVLLVDGFDLGGQPEQLCSTAFYDHCHAKLREEGVMVVNLWGGDGEYELYAARIRESFRGKVVVVATPSGDNRIAFAYKGRDFPPSPETLHERARGLGAAHRVPLRATAQKVLRRLRKCPSPPKLARVVRRGAP